MQNVTSERMHDYVFNAPLLLPGIPQAGLKFRFDADCPFHLRGMAARIPYDVRLKSQFGLQFVSMRWSGPDDDYRQTDYVPLNMLLGPYFGQIGNPSPVFPEVVFPRNGVTTIDLVYNGPFQSTLAGLQLFFRGVKKYPEGTASPYTYPEKQARAPLPFWYPLQVPNLAVTEPGLLNQPFAPENDSDFAFRFGQAGPVDGTYEVFMTLKDEAQKPYSNAPVHVDILFGRSLFLPTFPTGAALVSPVGPGASAPGLLVPEFYIPRNHKMWFDIQRFDLPYAGTVPVNYPLTFGGAKVFPG